LERYSHQQYTDFDNYSMKHTPISQINFLCEVRH